MNARGDNQPRTAREVRPPFSGREIFNTSANHITFLLTSGNTFMVYKRDGLRPLLYTKAGSSTKGEGFYFNGSSVDLAKFC